MWTRQGRNGKIRYCEFYIDYFTGKKKEVSVSFDKDSPKNRKEATQILARMIAEKEESKPSDITLSELVDKYRDYQKMSVQQSTYTRNYYAMESIKDIIGKDAIMSRLTALYIKKKMLESGKPNSTLNEHLSRFRALIRWAYSSDLIDSCKLAEKLVNFDDVPHKVKISEKYLETAEVEKLLGQIKHPVYSLLIEFLALSGLRCGECFALTNADVDLDAMVIHITKSYDSVNRKVVPAKTTSSIDDVVIQHQLADCIRRIKLLMLKQKLRYGYRTDLFFCDTKGEHIHYYAFNKFFRENTEKIIGKRLTPHSMRHSHASWLFEHDFTLDEVQRRLRHSDSKVTRDIYIHVTQKLREKDAKKLQKVQLFNLKSI